MFSSEFLEQYKKGKRLFSDIILQYVDISDADLSGIIIKDSKLFFATFRNCKFANSKFVNCEIIYGSFYGGNFENSVFDSSSIDATLFQNIVTKNMKIERSKIIWSAILDSAAGEVDTSSSSTFKFFTGLSNLTEKDIEDAMNHIGPLLDSLDISIRYKIMEEMKQDAKSFGIDIPKGTDNSNVSKNYSPQNLAYSMKAFSEKIISAYNTTNPYKNKKSAYEKEGKYKN